MRPPFPPAPRDQAAWEASREAGHVKGDGVCREDAGKSDGRRESPSYEGDQVRSFFFPWPWLRHMDTWTRLVRGWQCRRELLLRSEKECWDPWLAASVRYLGAARSQFPVFMAPNAAQFLQPHQQRTELVELWHSVQGAQRCHRQR